MTRQGMASTRGDTVANGQAGFSLVEALIAVLVFIIGIAAVSNLFLVAITANSAANHQAATTAIAAEVLDRLRAEPFANLTPGYPVGSGSGVFTTTASSGTYLSARRTALLPDVANDTCVEPAANCVTPGNYRMRRVVPGVADVHVNWMIVDTGNGLLFITVRAQDLAAVVGERSYAEVTTFRSIS
jgi:type IV pilus assembly protein PilV